MDGLFPAYCLGCRNEGGFLCADCRKSFVRLEEQMCPWCYELRPYGDVCFECKKGFPGGRFLDGVVVGSKFVENSLLQRVIHQLKYEFIEELAQPLGKFLVKTFLLLAEQDPDQHFVLCPLPLHLRRRRWRGFNQAELLCEVLLKELREAGYENVEVCNLLERVHFSRPQMELKREERLKNTQKAFVLNTTASISGAAAIPEKTTIVLVDDIATTLSTLNSAAEPLKKAGFERVWGLVLARVF